MLDGLNRLYRIGGIAFIASGSLFLTKAVLELMTGPPPSNGEDILAWMASRGFLIASTSEVFFFAVLFLVPAIFALYESLAATHRVSAVLGCGILGVTIPILCVLLIVHGRMMFPVYRLQIRSPGIAEFVIALYYGGLHAVAELQAVATFVLSLAMRRGPYGRNIAYLGFATTAFDLVGAYPWAIGPLLWFVSGVFFSAWFVAVGYRLCRMSAAAIPSAAEPTRPEASAGR